MGNRDLLHFAVTNVMNETAGRTFRVVQLRRPKGEREFIAIFTMKGGYEEDAAYLSLSPNEESGLYLEGAVRHRLCRRYRAALHGFAGDCPHMSGPKLSLNRYGSAQAEGRLIRAGRA